MKFGLTYLAAYHRDVRKPADFGARVRQWCFVPRSRSASDCPTLRASRKSKLMKRNGNKDVREN